MAKGNMKPGEAREMVVAGYRYALALTHHHYDAEDLVQQAWIKCHYRYGTVAQRRLLFTTIRNLFFDHVRRGRIILFEAMESAGESSLGDQNATTPGTHVDLDTLLAHLRAEEREALYLNAVEGYTAKEIAGLTDQSRNTVLSLIHRAKRKLEKLASAEARMKTPRDEEVDKNG